MFLLVPRTSLQGLTQQDAFNNLFPHDPQTGELSMSGYTDPSIGMKWH